MELELIRTYFPNGTNGVLQEAKQNKLEVICYTIELPWLDNKQKVSCIPEGRYELTKRYSQRFGWHLLVNGVTERELILIHPANDALKELKGCIAPVSILTAEGKGNNSKLALKKLQAVTSLTFDKGNKVYLNIKSHH